MPDTLEAPVKLKPAAEAAVAPKETAVEPKVTELFDNDELPILVKTALFTIEFYQNHLGQIKGSYCPMYPSCSEYGKIAITKYGYVGILKTFDRLHRCSHDLENYEVIIFDDEVRYLDEPN